MNTITLPEYLARIEQLIDENQFSEAVSHCHYILEKYPSHIDAYRLLAKTLLEQHEYDGASDLFQRVLSVDPNDFVSHVGLSVIRDEESQHEDALWHLERAFEIQPYNAAIQDELRRHYARYSDLAVDRIPLTSGALARLYIKGELYQQAVQELRQTVQREHDRVDLEVLLAEALWRNEQRIDAEEVCLNVLQKLPNCIAANAILSEIWLQTGRIGESQKYLRRLVDLTSMDKAHLDRDTAVGRAFRSDGAPPLPDIVELEFKRDMDGTAVPVAAATAVAASKSPSSDWMSEVTFDSDMSEKFEYGREGDVVPESPSGLHSYDWMADVNDSLDADGEELPLESEWFMDAVPAMSSDDDWLADLEPIAGSTAVVDDFDSLFDESEPLETSTAPDAEEDDWFLAHSDAELQPEESFASENVPEWLSDLVSEPDISAVGDDVMEPTVSSDWFDGSREEAAAQSSAEEFPDWLSTLVDEPASSKGDAPVADMAFAQPKAGSSGESDWLIDAHAEDAWDSGEYQAEAMPDWLQDGAEFDAANESAKESAAKPPVGHPPVEPATAVADDEMPDWLFKQTGELDESLAVAQGTVAQDDWFAEAGSDKAEQGEPEKEEPWFTGWLTDASADASADEESRVPEPAAKAGMAALGLTALFASIPDDELTDERDGESAGTQAEEIEDLWAGMTAAAITSPSVQLDEQNDDDWLSEFSGETWPDEVVEGSDTAVELDDLLQTSPDQLASTGGLDSNWLTMDDSSWLEDVAEGEPQVADSVSQFPQYPSEDLTANDEDEIPDWLLGSEPAKLDKADALGKTEVVVMGDDGDKNGQTKAEFPEPEIGDDEFGDLEDDWLSGMVDNKSQKDDAFAGADNWLTLSDADDELADDETEEGVPDWLSGFAASADQKEDALLTAGGWLEGDEEEDDFDLSDTEAEEGVPDWLMGTAVDKAPTEDAPVGLDSWLDMADEDDDLSLMHEAEEEDDLAGLFGDSSVMADWLSDGPEAVTAAADDDEDDFLAFDFEADDLDGAVEAGIPETAVKGAGLMAWLSALPEEDEAEPDEALNAVSSEPSLAESMPDIPSEELFATDAENFPDWLPAGLGPVSDLTDEESNLPDWLLDSADEKQDVVPARLESDELFDLEAEEMVDEWEDNPQWEVKDSLTAAGLTALFSSIDDEPARADMSMEAEMSWLTDIGKDETDLESVEESGLDWMDDEVDTAVAPVPKAEIVDIGADAAEDEMDDAISWLEELAYQQETPVEDLPTVAKDLLGDNLDYLDLPESADMDSFLVEETAMAVTDAENDDLWGDDLDFLDMPAPAADMAEVDEMATAVVGMTAADLDDELAADNDDDGGSWLDAFMDDEELTEDAALSAPPEGDDEAAMAWLEGLAAKQGAPLEELPSLQGRGEDDLDFLVDEAQSDLDDAMAWMDDLAAEPEAELEPKEEWPEVDDALFAAAFGTGAVGAVAGGAAFVEAESMSAEEDDELADALDFLEDQVKAEGIVPVVSGGKATLSEAELNDALDWLEGEAAIETAVPESFAAADQVDVWAEDDETWDEGSWEDDAAWPEPEAVDVGLDLANETASPLVTRSEEGDFDIFDMPDDPEEAMIWLDRMAHEDSEMGSAAVPPVVPLAAAVHEAVDDDDDWGTAVAEGDDLLAFNDGLDEDTVGAESDLIDDLGMFSSDVEFADMPEDPDAAMAWLEMFGGDGMIDVDMEPPPITPSADAKFVVEDSRPATAVVAAVPEPEIEAEEEIELEIEPNAASVEFDVLDIPEDPDEAMAWLEMFGGDGMIDVDMEPPPITPSADAKFVVEDSRPTTAVVAAVPELETEAEEEIELEIEPDAASMEFDVFDIPEDPDEAMAWLEMFGGDGMIDVDMEPPPITPSADAKFVVEDDRPATAVVKATMADEEPFISESGFTSAMPEDPDEAMAWLDKMADEQNALLEGALPPDESPLPSWMQMAADDRTLSDDLELAEPASFGAEDEGLGLIDDINDDLTDSLPDWFSVDSQESSLTGQTGWLRAIEDIDVNSWLSAEAEVSGTDFEDDQILPEVGHARPSKQTDTGRLPSLPPLAADMPAESYEVSAVPAIAMPSKEILQTSDVRSALAEKKYAEAAAHYQQLIASGTATMGLIAELETLADEYPQQPAFRRLLGDAYMRNGQLQKALNTYRVALDQL